MLLSLVLIALASAQTWQTSFVNTGTSCSTVANVISSLSTRTTCTPGTACVCASGYCINTACTNGQPPLPSNTAGYISYTGDCSTGTPTAIFAYGASGSCLGLTAGATTSARVSCNNDGSASYALWATSGTCAGTATASTTYNFGCVASGGVAVRSLCAANGVSATRTTCTVTIDWSATLNTAQINALAAVVNAFYGITPTFNATRAAASGSFDISFSGANAGAICNSIVANANVNSWFFNSTASLTSSGPGSTTTYPRVTRAAITSFAPALSISMALLGMALLLVSLL